MTEQAAEPTTGAYPVGIPPDTGTSPVARQMDGQVADLIMQHRPHNFLGLALMEGLVEGIRWAQAQRARAVVLRSALRHFCAGADVELFASAVHGVAPDQDVTELLRAFEELPLPIVASVHGVCVGGGLEIALACDLIIAAESAKIGSVEATIGLNPLMGAMQRITQRAGATRAKEMALLGRRYDARTLERWNVINRVVPDEQLVDATPTGPGARAWADGRARLHQAHHQRAVTQGVHAADEAMRELQKDLWASADLKEGLTSLFQRPGRSAIRG